MWYIVFSDTFKSKYFALKTFEKYGNTFQYILVEEISPTRESSARGVLQRANHLVLGIFRSFFGIVIEKVYEIVYRTKIASWIESDIVKTLYINGLREILTDGDTVLNFGGVMYPKSVFESEASILNIHGSVLPYYKGGASLYWALLNRDYSKIGVSIHEMTVELDAGSVLYTKHLLIREIKHPSLFFLSITDVAHDFIDLYFLDSSNFEINSELDTFTKGSKFRAKDLTIFQQFSANLIFFRRYFLELGHAILRFWKID